MSRSFVLSAIAAAALVGGVQVSSAADLPVKARPAPVAVWNWTGCYIGAQVGYGWGRSQATAVDASATFPAGFVFDPTDLSGVLGGGQVGCDYQFSSVVIGIEGDYDFASITGSETSASPLIAGRTVKTDSSYKWLASATGRIGYAWDKALLYVKGGGAWTHNDSFSNVMNAAGAVIATSTGTDPRSGWTIGAGLEYAFARNWSARVEYDYYDFGSATVTRVVSTGAVNIRTQSLTLNALKFAVNYRFNLF